MSLFSKIIIHFLLLGFTSVVAANGYLSHGVGTKNKGMGGAGVALPQSALAGATNPAGMVWVGNRFDAGVAVSDAGRRYTAHEPDFFTLNSLYPTTVSSVSDYNILPHIGLNWMIDSESSVGFSFYANEGINTVWPDDVGNGMGTLGAMLGNEPLSLKLNQMFLNTTYSRKFGDKASWGISAVIARQTFENTGVGFFNSFSADPNNVTSQGTDNTFGLGAQIGFQGEITPGLVIGGSYRSRIDMAEHDMYRGLLAEQGDLDIPPRLRLGLSYEGDFGTVVFDVEHIMYENVASLRNPMFPNLEGCILGDNESCYGGESGPGFGWEDITVGMIGYQWATSDTWTWRVGYRKGNQPIPSTEIFQNLMTASVADEQYTFGFTRQAGQDSEISFSAMYAPENSVTGPSQLDQGQDITLVSSRWEIEGSWGWRF